MKTPVCDFLREYNEKNTVRMHMPGHKGRLVTGYEPCDLTEVFGADSLYEADGIIAESERYASNLFGAHTFFSAEGSSLSIRAMVYLTSLYSKERGESECRILAARNAHRAFVSAAALVGCEVDWLYGEEKENYLSTSVTPEVLTHAIEERRPSAVYITSPDYLGNMLDVRGLAEVCRRFNIPLLVDNAHGAYLRFLEPSMHPITLGATAACDSAHKTLSSLTGGAYLHISEDAPAVFRKEARAALSLFGSSSPSYLILSSLDKTNAELADGFSHRISECIERVSALKEKLSSLGYSLLSGEPLKITLEAKKYGYFGYELADILRKSNIECEFSDKDYLVLMPSVYSSESDFDALLSAFSSVEKKAVSFSLAPSVPRAARALSVREALMSPREKIPTELACGRVLGSINFSCPPAVPIAIAGELVDESVVAALRYYGITEVDVVKK